VNPDASQQVFVLLLGLTSLGLVGGSLIESGAFRPSTDPPPQVIAAGPIQDDGAASDQAEVPDEGSAAALQPHEVVPLGVPEDGSGDVDPTAEGANLALGAGPNDATWEPLRTAEDGACLVRLNRATMATTIDRREPRGTEGPFMANGEPIFCFMDFANGTGVSQPVSVVWTQNETGASYLDDMEAGAGSRWRTWTERPLPLDRLGHWTVQMLDAERCLIAELEFDLVAPTW
jgi:hypothetical protein